MTKTNSNGIGVEEFSATSSNGNGAIDSAAVVNGSNSNKKKTRYSDQELAEFEVNIRKKYDVAEELYREYKSVLTGEDGNDVTDTSPTFKVMEEGATTLSKEDAARLARRQFEFMQHLKNALIRVKNKTYGICFETGELISKQRLMAVPHATLSIGAKKNQN